MTEDEQKQLLELLQKLEPGFYPIEIFWELARLVVMSIVEFVPLRLTADGKVEVLLLKRADDDRFWPGQLHTPGTVVRPSDVGANTTYLPFKRILEDELAGTEVSAPHYVGSVFHQTPRGADLAQVYWVEVSGEPKVGRFYPIDNLPTETVATQPKFIKQAAASFLAAKQQSQ